jgi:hypothetical protein
LVLTPFFNFFLSLCFVVDTVDIINLHYLYFLHHLCSSGPFGTNPQYGMDYWPKNASLIQVDCDASKLGRVKPLKRSDVGVAGDAALAAK